MASLAYERLQKSLAAKTSLYVSANASLPKESDEMSRLDSVILLEAWSLVEALADETPSTPANAPAVTSTNTVDEAVVSTVTVDAPGREVEQEAVDNASDELPKANGTSTKPANSSAPVPSPTVAEQEDDDAETEVDVQDEEDFDEDQADEDVDVEQADEDVDEQEEHEDDQEGDAEDDD